VIVSLHRSLASVVMLVTALALCGRHAIAAQSEMVIVKGTSGQGEKHYHRPGCPVIKDGKDVLAMTRAEAESRGVKAHRDCDPALSAPSAEPQGPASGTPRTAPPETVFIDTAGTHYHRKNCARLEKDAKAVPLTNVGKRWPCATCRPPVPKRTTEPLVPRWRGSGPGRATPVRSDTQAPLSWTLRS
jgi:hypothetical protein